MGCFFLGGGGILSFKKSLERRLSNINTNISISIKEIQKIFLYQGRAEGEDKIYILLDLQT